MDINAYGSMPPQHPDNTTISLIEFSAPFERPDLRFAVFPSSSAPPFVSVTHSVDVGNDGSVPDELQHLIRLIANRTGIRHFWVDGVCCTHCSVYDALDQADRNVLWLGPAADDSDVAVQCLSRLERRPLATPVRKLWSRREGRALLALSERTIWKDPNLASDLAVSHNVDLYCGDSQTTWGSVVHFRDLLGAIVREGRVEHHEYAHAILASFASDVVKEALDDSYSENAPPLELTHCAAMCNDMSDLMDHLDMSISAVETRWNTLSEENQGCEAAVPTIQSEAEVDAQLARYQRLLHQIDVFDADLRQLDTFTSELRTMQYEARSPRNSPEISP